MQTYSRREILKLGAAAVALSPWTVALAKTHGIAVNDVHSQLNPTLVSKIVNADRRTMSDLQSRLPDRAERLARSAAPGMQQVGSNS